MNLHSVRGELRYFFWITRYSSRNWRNLGAHIWEITPNTENPNFTEWSEEVRNAANRLPICGSRTSARNPVTEISWGNGHCRECARSLPAGILAYTRTYMPPMR